MGKTNHGRVVQTLSDVPVNQSVINPIDVEGRTVAVCYGTCEVLTRNHKLSAYSVSSVLN